ncbi:MAG: DNA-directed RNA polymerase subunit alpha [Candidatus Woesebacteria bacterium GW2011_GWB1_39_12]|uniref:DNA-directed RNA polymerase subunit alpha n=1 Tax=Candidatus Woesebacteria bacterium GW2011_GWB1_39_12 TaxID=1618574 RepID=A0A0G0M7T4_9BACT|nr:MAG: DNA-directed RNA polymerase subunit alpha [Candidatus Woesebacteria bacterium GW2011_GWB1_39_12]
MTNEPIFEVKEEEKKGNYARFVISPLEQGYGDTLGNSLRRVLLMSLPGAAIVSVKIQGVKHQFSTLKGMKEDVVEFLLNLKKVRFKVSSENPTKASISASGPGDIKASDIKTDAEIVVANPDLFLASLSKGTKLEAKLEIEVGTGYMPSEERIKEEIGLIPLDATIDPKEALLSSAKILVGYFNQLVSPKKVEKKEELKKDELGVTGKLSVEEIGLPTRVANALVKAGYESVEDLVSAKRDELVKVRNLGEKSVKIIEAALGEKGLVLPN